MIKIFIAMALTILLAACRPDSSAPQSAETTGTAEPAGPAIVAVDEHSGLLPQYMNLEVRPGDDFNAYVNGGWIDTAEIPADRASAGAMLMVHEQSQEDVKIIIEESAEGDFAQGTDEQKVGDLYKSYMDMETRNALGVKPLQNELAKIAALENYQDLAVYFAEANKLGINVPITLQQYADMKDNSIYMMYTWQGGLGLPDREYYFKDDEKSEAIRQAYVEHIRTMFDLASLPDGENAAQTIMALETRIANEHMVKENARDFANNYNKIPLAELPGLMPEFSWDAWLDAAMIGDIDGLVVMHSDYMKALDGIITSTPMDDWKTYLAWQALNAEASLLNEELDNQNFEFYSKTPAWCGTAITAVETCRRHRQRQPRRSRRQSICGTSFSAGGQRAHAGAGWQPAQSLRDQYQGTGLDDRCHQG